MSGFVACASCRRLIANDEGCCPFCRVPSRSCRAAQVLLGLTLALGGCSEGSNAEEATAVADASGTGTGTSTDATVSTEDTSGGTTEDSGADAATSDDPSTTGGFYAGGDTGGNSCGVECDILAVADCPEGEKCTAVGCYGAWDTNVCRDIQGSAQLGEECELTGGAGFSGNDTCAEGLICWDPDAESGLGACIAFCKGSYDSPDCPEGTSCMITNNGVLPLCFETCDPLAQDCADAGDLCVPNPQFDTYVCLPNVGGNMAPYGTPCSVANECDSGLICIEAEFVPEASCETASGCCSPLCSISAGAPCPGAGQSCEPVIDPPPAGYEDVGVCKAVP